MARLQLVQRWLNLACPSPQSLPRSIFRQTDLRANLRGAKGSIFKKSEIDVNQFQRGSRAGKLRARSSVRRVLPISTPAGTSPPVQKKPKRIVRFRHGILALDSFWACLERVLGVFTAAAHCRFWSNTCYAKHRRDHLVSSFAPRNWRPNASFAERKATL